ncbi:hypothetical protein C7999DRAFT_18457 [Corynascus novoguineensis]|uniref:Uncharacterized protein n=1 Tax=Corynascus novoguineensis TaxID=1126955 RepID=A0AAN7HFB6_9PEZI|nr:hypothetical protein C7999DRAFT_18457 [Corynascus novoguineensis]
MLVDETEPPRDPLVRPPAPVLRLRPTVPTELIRPPQRIKGPDGPLIAHPGLIRDQEPFTTGNYPPNITMDQYRELWRADLDEFQRNIRAARSTTELELGWVMKLHPVVDMQRLEGWTDDEIALAVERTYSGAHVYLRPGTLMPPSLVDRFGADWRNNARGIYYRHFYSPGWVTADHSLWLPSLRGDSGEDIDWNCPGEERRRARASIFLKHVLDNERWKKAEYTWEADAWTDVFGLMRDDPLLTVDKHEYNTIGKEAYPASCVLSGKTKLLARKPDATFGLATFQPRDYQRSVVANWNLDHDRLEALLVHRHCGLISDPRWGDANLVFPFAVYEAKGWDGDPREARQQACSAGAVYLDMLERLSKRPGGIWDSRSDAYQTVGSRNTQVFVFTSFGAHWHILVGYKRPRLKREYAGREGMSESVYVFQRIWSARAVTERKAWELISLIDQIHLWGVTDHRDFVIQHLKPWHEFAEKCYARDVNRMLGYVDTGGTFDPKTGSHKWCIPKVCVRLPEWTRHLTNGFSARQKHLEERAAFQVKEAFVRYQNYAKARADTRARNTVEVSAVGHVCAMDEECGYCLESWEEFFTHAREVHGADDHTVLFLNRITDRNSSSSTPRRAQKRRREEVDSD